MVHRDPFIRLRTCVCLPQAVTIVSWSFLRKTLELAKYCRLGYLHGKIRVTILRLPALGAYCQLGGSVRYERDTDSAFTFFHRTL